jgi:hydrogenase nickel incorporation protein HypA/HybF
MHELSIVEALLGQIDEQLREHPGTRLTAVRLRVGALRQVVPEMLRFCFTAAIRDTALAGAELVVDETAAEARCGRCARTFAVDDHWFECPHCRSLGADLLRGNELELTSLELQPVN